MVNPRELDQGPELDPHEPLGTAARREGRWLLARMRYHEVGTREGEDPEELHQMRVATRRLRAMLATFGEAFEPSSRRLLRSELRWLAGVQGVVRDLDVHRSAVPRWRSTLCGGALARRGWEHVERRLEERWHPARVELIDALDGERYRRLVAMAEDAFVLESIPSTEVGGRSLADVLPQLLRRPLRRFDRARKSFEREGTMDAAHRLRIAAKGLRYATDLVGPLLGARARRRLLRLLRFQDVLGELQDATVAAALARQLAEEEAEARSDPSLSFALGQLHGASMVELEQGPARVRQALRGLGARKLRRRVERAARGLRDA